MLLAVIVLLVVGGLLFFSIKRGFHKYRSISVTNTFLLIHAVALFSMVSCMSIAMYLSSSDLLWGYAALSILLVSFGAAWYTTNLTAMFIISVLQCIAAIWLIVDLSSNSTAVALMCVYLGWVLYECWFTNKLLNDNQIDFYGFARVGVEEGV